MMHILDYKTEKIVGTLENKEETALFWQDVHKQSLKDNLETFNFTMQADVKESEYVSERNRVIIPDEDGFFREFIIHETDQHTDHTKDVYTKASYTELKKQKIINPVTLEGQTVNTAGDYILDGTSWQVGITEYAGTRKVIFEDHTDALKALQSIATLFGLELRFRVEIKGNRIVGRFVDFIKRVGRDNKKEVELGKDLIGITRKENTDDVVTALIVLGPEKEDGTRLIVEIKDEDARQRWSDKDNRHLWAIYEPQTSNSSITESELTNLGRDELDKRINSLVEYTADAAGIEHIFEYEHEKVRKGDTVRIKDTSFVPPLYVEARVIDVERSVSNPSAKIFILGDFIEYSEENVMATFKKLQAILQHKASTGDIEAVKEYIDQNEGEWSKFLYTWIMFADSETGDGITSDPTGKPYLGIAYNKETDTPSMDPTVYTWTEIKGDQGVPGPPGENGQPTYTWIKYGDDANGLNMSDNPSGKLYMGVASNKTTETEGNDPTDYKWSLIKGEKGDKGEDGYTPIKGVDYFDGIDGQDGADGKSSYLWVRYSQNSNGNPMNDNPAGALYIGVATTETPTAPTTYTAYKWSLIKGDQGVKGEAGADGRTSYLHVKYSNDGGTTFTANNGETVGDWIGTYVDFNSADSTSVANYTWNKVKGDKGDTGERGPQGLQGLQGPKGDQGIQGPSGDDGVSSYTHIAYANNSTGTSGFSVSDSTNKLYIGIYVDSNPSDSLDPSEYAWTLIKGQKGDQGIQGPVGEDGKTPYFHTAWANNETGTSGFSTIDATNKTYIGTYTDYVSADSSDPSKYTWVKIKGETGATGPQGPQGEQGLRGLQGVQGPQGDQGIQGPKGDNGLTAYTHIAYADNASGGGFSQSPTGKEYIGMYVDHTQADSADPSKYAWSLIKGADGANGIQGPKGDDGRTPYLHIAYANNSTGTSGFSTTDSTGKTYIGQYTDFVQADSNTPSNYKWSLIKGEKGDTGERGPQGLQGLQGPKGDQGIKGDTGANGLTAYAHIAYANSANGTNGFSVSDSANKLYIGMYTDHSAADSTNPSDYNWTLIKGADGAQGIPGPTGENGQTPYLHIAYATNSAGTSGFSTTVSVGKTYIGQYTDFIQADSNDPSKYAWTLIKGDTGPTGPKGDTGPQGPNIVDSTTTIEANVIKSNHIDVSNLSAIIADLGTVTAGTIQGVKYESSGANGHVIIVDDIVKASDSLGPIRSEAYLMGGALFIEHFENDIKMQRAEISRTKITFYDDEHDLTIPLNIGYVGVDTDNVTNAFINSDTGVITTNINQLKFESGPSIDVTGGSARWKKDDSNYIAQFSSEIQFFIGGYAHMEFGFQASGANPFIKGSAGDGAMIKFITDDSIQLRNHTDTDYANLAVKTLTEVSTRGSKKNIVKVLDEYLDGVLSTTVYRYHYNDEDDNEYKHLGIIYDESPPEIVNPNGEGIHPYAMTTYLWKAVQELTRKVENLESKLKGQII
jgi:phage minor structural protein